MSREDVLHRLIDAAAGIRNIGAGEADGLHDDVTPNYSAKPLSAAEAAQLAELEAKRAAIAAQQAAAYVHAPAAGAETAPAPVPVAPESYGG